MNVLALLVELVDGWDPHMMIMALLLLLEEHLLLQLPLPLPLPAYGATTSLLGSMMDDGYWLLWLWCWCWMMVEVVWGILSLRLERRMCGRVLRLRYTLLAVHDCVLGYAGVVLTSRLLTERIICLLSWDYDYDDCYWVMILCSPPAPVLSHHESLSNMRSW